MGRKARVEPPDTVDDIHLLLSSLQAQGWNMHRCGLRWDYAAPSTKDRKIPVGLRLTITLKIA
jgi:hypothetical protein